MNYKKRIAILGATGSVGRQAFDVALGNYDIVLLTGGANVKLLAEQIRASRCPLAALPTEAAAQELRLLLKGEEVKVYGGEDAVCRCIEECGADVFVHSIAGMAGIPSALAASASGARLAIANKEAIISVGDMIYDNIRRSGGELIPVDSEHCAIFQCLLTSGAVDAKGAKYPDKVKRILLTASGGPFFGKKFDELSAVTPQMALSHPTWVMGQKITVDSATLMNKGFEIIEGARLFGVDIDRIEVLIHRQSIIHSMVEYTDNMVMAQLGAPDMRHCIRYAISYPKRMEVAESGLDFAALGSLSFAAPDYDAFPLLRAAVKAYKMGTTAPAALIASDEVAVDAFLKGKIGFTDIYRVVEETLCRFVPHTEYTVETVYEAERFARNTAQGVVSSIDR